MYLQRGLIFLTVIGLNFFILAESSHSIDESLANEEIATEVATEFEVTTEEHSMEDDSLGSHWVTVENIEDCESDITAYDVSIIDSAPLECLKKNVTKENGEKCSVEDDFSEECWTTIENGEDCESDVTAYNIDVESLPFLCLVQETL